MAIYFLDSSAAVKQLAAAMELRDSGQALGLLPTLVSADLELNVAAAAEGLATEDPNSHPA